MGPGEQGRNLLLEMIGDFVGLGHGHLGADHKMQIDVALVACPARPELMEVDVQGVMAPDRSHYALDLVFGRARSSS